MLVKSAPTFAGHDQQVLGAQPGGLLEHLGGHVDGLLALGLVRRTERGAPVKPGGDAGDRDAGGLGGSGDLLAAGLPIGPGQGFAHPADAHLEPGEPGSLGLLERLLDRRCPEEPLVDSLQHGAISLCGATLAET